MHLLGSRMSGLGFALIGLLVALVSAQARNFTVPTLQSHQDGRVNGSTPANTTILFTLIDVHANRSTTDCAASFYPATATTTYYQRFYCTDHHFGWYFSIFNDISNFSINVIHSYVDRAVGPRPIRLYGTSSLISRATVPGFLCRQSSGGSFTCGFHNETAPIVIPVTGMVGRTKEPKEPKDTEDA
ncbi:MAG: hypothetical protein Q9187_007755 [Circinaria calcarea]